MLKLINVTKDYKTGGNVVQALKGVSLEFRQNEFVSILGPSGCGKTTLLNIIGGLDHYTTGDLIIRGVSTKEYKDRDWDIYRNHRIGFVFQSYNLIPHQTVLGNVELALTIAGLSKEERKKRAQEALERVGLGTELHKRPNQLSGGQMQRVAIARALVNNPEILLADEPTGALDSKTSVQIMELIREIAGERLVIMVTHNPELAEQYSSRIVRLSDGLVVDDTNPYISANEKAEELEQPVETVALEEPPQKATPKKKKEKASMSLLTSFGLSARNLLAKKGRTTVTAFAGSIGIISVCLVLALSNGFNNYILKTEEDMLSYYPLEVKESTVDVNSIMAGMSSGTDMPDLSELDDKVYVNSFLSKLAKGLTVKNNLSDEYLAYVQDMDEGLYHAIQYKYGVSLSDNMFTEVVTGATAEESKTQIMSLSALKEFYTTELTANAGQEYGQMAYLVDYLGAVMSVMPGTDDVDGDRYGDYVLSQYDVFGDFPSSPNEAVLVIGGNNDASDLLLAQLGFIEEYKFLSLFDKSAEGSDEYMTVDFEEIRNKPFTLYYNDEVYKPNTTFGATYPFVYSGSRTDLTATAEQGVQIKISGILRLKDGLTYGCLSSGLNITGQLLKDYIAKNKTSQIVQWMKSDAAEITPDEMKGFIPNAGQDVNVPSMSFYFSPAANLNVYYKQLSDYISEGLMIDPYLNYTQSDALRHLGGEDRPKGIAFYPKDFDTKEDMMAYLDAWNKTCAEEDKITYTDTVGLMMGMVKTMLDAITYVLVAFTAISLVVSSVMIGIITYVSVVERTKEIGVLRSLGARKRDIKNLFNAETFIIGLSSGVFGVAATYLISLGINALLSPLTGIAQIAALPFTSALVMIAISVGLTLISGLIPAKSAAKKDPVIALRTE